MSLLSPEFCVRHVYVRVYVNNGSKHIAVSICVCVCLSAAGAVAAAF